MRSLLDPRDEVTSGAAPVEAAIDTPALQNNAMATDIEARLTGEMRRFGTLCRDVSDRFKAISESAGDDLGKLVAASQRLFLLELSNAILKSMRECSSLAEYVDHLGELELGFRDAFREVVLDGRKFMCIALTDECAREFFRGNQGSEQGGYVHEDVPSEGRSSQEAA